MTVSAMLFEESVPGKAFYGALELGRILLSSTTTQELERVLRRKKFDRYITREEREQFLQVLIKEAKLIEIKELVRACRDKKDDKFLELAVNGKAASLITGDKDLLVLHPFEGIAIVTPQQFLETFGKSD